jgi:transcriptional regulator GlxA family with amidase domain
LKTRPVLVAVPRPPTPCRKRVVVLVIPPVEELDLVGPVGVFAGVNRILGTRGPAYRIEIVTVGPDRVIQGDCGLSFNVDGLYKNIRGTVDTLLVVAGLTSRNIRNEALFQWLRNMAPKVRRLVSICVGTFVLAEAGLLNGKRATTHWAYVDELVERYPRVEVHADRLWIQDGRIYTSAGVTAGMDLALALVEHDQGSSVALEVARGLVLFLRRSGGQSQFSVSLAAQTSERKVIRDLQVWMAEHIQDKLSVDNLATIAAMSSRNFARVFVRETGVTPAKYVEQLRLEAARRQMEDSDMSLEEIAGSCGFSSAELMRRLFLRSFHVSPRTYRSRFQTRLCNNQP